MGGARRAAGLGPRHRRQLPHQLRQILARRRCARAATAPPAAPTSRGAGPRGATTPHDDIIRPGLAAPTGDITVVLDTSGSMSGADHAKAFTEVDAVLKKVVPGEAIRVLSVDDEVHTDQRVVQTRQITPVGGRGTDMSAGIETAAQRSPAAIIVITDGYTPWPQDPPPGRAQSDRRAHPHRLHQPGPGLDPGHRHQRPRPRRRLGPPTTGSPRHTPRTPTGSLMVDRLTRRL